MGSNAKSIVRDFVYVDIERLYSFYSQVFEGVTEQIVESFTDSMSSSDKQRASMLGGKSIEAQVAEVSRRTESTFLYDHMYSRLEEKIETAIVRLEDMTRENYRERLKGVSLIRVSGRAAIEDYERIVAFAKQFNEMGQAIAYAGLKAEKPSLNITELKQLASQAKDRERRLAAKAQLESIGSLDQTASKMGLQQDEHVLNSIRLFAEFFYPNGYDITISPGDSVSEITYRAVADRRWLRVSPEILRALYGEQTAPNWTVVGQVTHVPSAKVSDAVTDIAGATAADPPSIRDGFRGMFRAARNLESLFFQGNESVEIVVCPLAIYRELPMVTEPLQAKDGR